MIEPEHGDVAFEFSGQALGAGEMAEHRGTGMLTVALLDAEPAGQQSVAPGGIDQEFGAPGATARFILADCADAAARGIEIDIGDPAFLDNGRALRGGVLQQDVIEFRAAHLIGIGMTLVPGIGEFEIHRLLVVRRDEFRAVFDHADAADFLAETELVDQLTAKAAKPEA